MRSTANKQAAVRSVSWLMMAIIVVAAAPAGAGVPAMPAEPVLLPKPSRLERLSGPALDVHRGSRVVFTPGDEAGRNAANQLAGWASRYLGLRLVTAETGTRLPGDIVIDSPGPDSTASHESYRLEVTSEGARVHGADAAGEFYGAVSLWQLIARSLRGSHAELAPVRVEDAPRFSWRGLMLDSARHMQSVSYIERLLDWMALHKFNRFHWHLTDDQGWRLEIAGHPRLTSVGAWRPAVGVDREGPHVRRKGRALWYGGYYSRADISAIVDYAARRHIIVVPEIEMPGHTTAVIAAYPEFGTPGFHAATPTPDWGILPNLLNVDDRTVAAMDAILDEVMELFPGPYIHVGGDEVPKNQWRESTAVQEEMQRRGLRDEVMLETDFTRRIAQHVAAKGRQLIGWDDILEGGAVENALVMSWRGERGAVLAAKHGEDAVMVIAPTYYLDNREVNSATEPPGWTEEIGLAQIYGLDPLPAALSVVEAKHVVGLEGALWTERARKEAWVTALVFPRAAALAEAAWTAQSQRDFADFSRRLETMRGIYAAVGINPGGPFFTAPSRGGRLDRSGQTSSLDLDFCTPGTVGLVIEGAHSPSGHPRLYKVDTRRPCWVKRGANVVPGSRMTLALAQVPFNFEFDASHPQVRSPPSCSPAGAMEVHADRWDGELLACVPLTGLGLNRSPRRFRVKIEPFEGEHDLYFVLTGYDIRPGDNRVMPLTVIDWIELTHAPQAPVAQTRLRQGAVARPGSASHG
jgi:hexosaminidase